jgi:serine protease Do
VNVAKSIGSEQLSFLVPGHYARTLLARAQAQGYTPPKSFRAEIGKQLSEWQAALYKSLIAAGFHQTEFGPYHVPETDARWFTCWSNTNAGSKPKPRVDLKSTSCGSGSSLFVASDLTTGRVQVSHLHARAAGYNQFQFAAFLSLQLGARQHAVASKWLTQRRCHEDVAAVAPGRPSLRVVWCVTAYRDFEGLYDVGVTAVTQDRSSEALVSRLTMQAVNFDTAMTLTRTFIEAIR